MLQPLHTASRQDTTVAKGENGDEGGGEDVTELRHLGYEQSLPRRFTFIHVLAINTVVCGYLYAFNGECLASGPKP